MSHTSPQETVRSLKCLMTTAIWREALAKKQGRAGAANLASTQRQAASDRLLSLADDWRSDRRAALLGH
jgi:hypothetical protein